MAISRRLVEMMGGRIWLESEAGKGSTFHFTVRLGVQDPSAQAPVPEPVSLSGLPVLVVDDNATNCLILQEVLTRWGMKPTLANGAPAALAAMQEAAQAGEPFALVLSDVMMPGTDGFQLAEQIHRQPELARAAIMMLSSAGQQQETARCREVGVAGYLTKPVKQSELLEAILAALGQSAKDRREEAASARRRHRPAASGSRPLRILLAEDNATNQFLAVTLLEKEGHSVRVADNGREALTALEQETFDVVLMDVQMPEMDGFEATRRIREQEKETGRHVPIIAMTAHAMRSDRERCLAAGMDDYISKPVQARELYEALAPLRTNGEEDQKKESPKESQREALSGSEVARPGPGSETPPARPPAAILDRAALLARVGGREDRLRKIIDIFLAESSTLMAEMRQAITAGDAARLKRPAHSLKGAVGLFNVPAVFEAVQKLESLGTTGELAGAADVYTRLEEELGRLQPALSALLVQPAGTGPRN